MNLNKMPLILSKKPGGKKDKRYNVVLPSLKRNETLQDEESKEEKKNRSIERIKEHLDNIFISKRSRQKEHLATEEQVKRRIFNIRKLTTNKKSLRQHET